jgi:hypothetical protein
MGLCLAQSLSCSRRERLSACPHRQAKDAKVNFDKKSGGWGVCELNVLGARKFLEVVLLDISVVRI